MAMSGEMEEVAVFTFEPFLAMMAARMPAPAPI